MAVAYDVQHYLLTFGGNTVGGHEEWQCGLRWAPFSGDHPTNEWESALNEISITDIYNAAKLFFGATTIGARWDTSTSLEFVKLAVLKTDGKYLLDPREHRQQTKGTVNAAYTTPPQLAVAVSLSSGTKIGHANHGRFYLPCPNDWVNNVEPSTGQVVTVEAALAAPPVKEG